MIGLPVDVHVKDGSVYSGIFHTASADAGYGVVLKKARMIKKGKCNSNVGEQALVDTLLIPSDDLVQVVSKGITLPSNGVGGTCEIENDVGPMIDAKLVNQSSQAADVLSKGIADECRQKSEFANERSDEKIQSSNSSHEIDTCVGEVEAVERGSADTTSSPHDNGLLCNNVPASVKANNSCTNSTLGVDLISESHDFPEKSVEISNPLGTDSIKNAKEFKLNPGAKLFSPSVVHPMIVTTALPTAPNMVYIPNSSLPTTTIQPERGFTTFASRPSAPVKVAQYNNFTAGNGGSGSQFSQPLAHRTQPLRYAAHYDPILSEPAYLQPNSPAVMAGRSTQLVYPTSQDWIHGAMAMSPASARPLLNHVQYPKQQGGTVGQAMPACMHPPVLTSGQQPFPLHSHIPHLHPGFPSPRPISVPGPNSFYGTKFS